MSLAMFLAAVICASRFALENVGGVEGIPAGFGTGVALGGVMGIIPAGVLGTGVGAGGSGAGGSGAGGSGAGGSGAASATYGIAGLTPRAMQRAMAKSAMRRAMAINRYMESEGVDREKMQRVAKTNV